VSRLEKEVHEQPAVLERLLRKQLPRMREVAGYLRRRGVEFVYAVARGSSDNAVLYGKYLLGTRNRLVVALAAPSMFTIYRRPPRLPPGLVLAVSQSGQSDDLCRVIEEARRQGQPTLALCNSPRSPLARAAELVIDLRAGVERSVAATKSYTAQLLALAMLSVCLDGGRREFELLQRLPERVASLLAASEERAGAAERYRYLDRLSVIGRGYNYATAFELALKLKELAYLSAEPASSADFRHGPIAMVESGYAVLLVAPRGRVFADVRRLAGQLRQRRAELLVISDHRPLLDQAQLALPLEPGQAEWLTPVEAVVPGQLLALQLARCRGCPLDRPRGLSKVTRTR